MANKKIQQNGFVDEDEELRELLGRLQQTWNHYEQYLNRLEDELLIEEWTYKTMVQRQLYRYILRFVRKSYERKGNDDQRLDRPRSNWRLFFAR